MRTQRRRHSANRIWVAGSDSQICCTPTRPIVFPRATIRKIHRWKLPHSCFCVVVALDVGMTVGPSSDNPNINVIIVILIT